MSEIIVWRSNDKSGMNGQEWDPLHILPNEYMVRTMEQNKLKHVVYLKFNPVKEIVKHIQTKFALQEDLELKVSWLAFEGSEQ